MLDRSNADGDAPGEDLSDALRQLNQALGGGQALNEVMERIVPNM